MAADAQTRDTTLETTRKPIYEGSSQFRHWRFSKAQLTSMRASLNGAAVAAIRNAFEADLAG